MSTDFILYSVLSGTFAALASVSAKLFSDSRTLSFTIYVCEVVYGSGCEDVENGVCIMYVYIDSYEIQLRVISDGSCDVMLFLTIAIS